jgi:hypothetical protein
MTTDWSRKLRLRQERLGLLRVVEELPERVTKMETTFNGRLVPMSLAKVKWLDRADDTIKRLDGKTKP